MCWYFKSFYLEQRIWLDAISLRVRQRNSIKFCENFGKRSKETLSMIRQAFGEESMSRARKVQTRRDLKGEVRSKVKSMLIIIVDTKNTSWRTTQPIPHATVMFCGDCITMWEDFFQSFGTKELAVASRQHTVSHFLFYQGIFFTKNNMTVVTYPPYFSVSQIEDTNKRKPFGHNWGDWGRTAGGAEYDF
jgi:hypothetical protein